MDPASGPSHLTISPLSPPRKRRRPSALAIFASSDEEVVPDISAAKAASVTAQPSDVRSLSAAPATYIPDLQRRHLRRRMARRLGSTPKRHRPVLPADHQSAAIKPTGGMPKPQPEPPHINGRTPLRKVPLSPRSLWERLHAAQALLDSQTRADPRFVSARRPLDCLDNLRPSIVITMFIDGYARHDWTATSGEGVSKGAAAEGGETAGQGRASASSPKGGGPKNGGVATMPRFPYDRASRDFLRALDLGLIPPSEDLPEPAMRHYYDGCLIAEINDVRDMAFSSNSMPRPEARKRIILRPEMSSVYHDVSVFTRSCNRAVALLAEEKILKAIAGPVDCDPIPTLTPPVHQTAAHTNTHAFNIARRPTRKRLRRPRGQPVVPSLSAAALVLISQSAKHQTLQRYAAAGLGGASKESSSVQIPYRISDPVLMSNGVRLPLASARKDDDAINIIEQIAAQANEAALKGGPPEAQRPFMKNGVLFPPKMLFDRQIGKGEVAVTAALNLGSAAPGDRAQPQQERLRVIRLVEPDEKGDIAMLQAQRQLLADAKGSTSREQVMEAKQRALANTDKPGKQIVILDMFRKGKRAIDTNIFRGLQIDKPKDVFRVSHRNAELGHAFLAQFKYIAMKEGYFCMQDLRPQPLTGQQAQAAQQREAANVVEKQHAIPPSLITSQPQQAQVKPPEARASSQGHIQNNSHQILQAQKQKQFQMQRQQAMQRQRHQMLGQALSQAQQQQSAHMNQQAQQRQSMQHVQQLPHQQSAQHQLGQVPQHPQQIALQHQQQLLRHQLRQQQMQQQLQQQQNSERALRIHQMQRHEKGNANNGIQNSAPVLSANGPTAHGFSKALDAGQAAVSGMARTANPGMSRNPAQLASMGSSALLGQNTTFSPAQMEHLNQIRTQQIREQQRHMMVPGAGGHPAPGFQRNGNLPANPLTTAQHHIQSQALVGLNAAMPNMNGRPGAAPNLNGADALSQHRMQQHFKQQRENIEAQARTGKR